MAALRTALLLLTCEAADRDRRIGMVSVEVGVLPDALAAPLARCAAVVARLDAADLPASQDEDLAHLCALLEAATVGDTLRGGLTLSGQRDQVEDLRAAHRRSGSPWTGALEAVCATLGTEAATAPDAIDEARDTVAPGDEPRGPIKVFLVDDHEVVRRGLRDLLEVTGEFEVVGESSTAGRATALIPALRPDVAILDGRLPDGSGMEVCRDVRSVDPTIRALILTSYDDDDALFTAILAGASGYVLKQASSGDLLDAIRRVAAGQSLIDPALTARVLDRLRHPEPEITGLAGITEREREILELIADGLTNRQIGERLCLAEKTVKNYVSALLGKLGLERRTQAAVLAARLLH